MWEWLKKRLSPLGSPPPSPPTDTAWRLSEGTKAVSRGLVHLSNHHHSFFPSPGNRKQNSLGRVPSTRSASTWAAENSQVPGTLGPSLCLSSKEKEASNLGAILMFKYTDCHEVLQSKSQVGAGMHVCVCS